jgi:hypothetical protein
MLYYISTTATKPQQILHNAAIRRNERSREAPHRFRAAAENPENSFCGKVFIE